MDYAVCCVLWQLMHLFYFFWSKTRKKKLFLCKPCLQLTHIPGHTHPHHQAYTLWRISSSVPGYWPPCLGKRSLCCNPVGSPAPGRKVKWRGASLPCGEWWAVQERRVGETSDPEAAVCPYLEH